MKTKLFLLLTILFSICTYSQKTIIGKWKTIDDSTKEAKSIVELYKLNNEYFGKIITILTQKGINHLRYNTKHKVNADWAATVAHLRGMKTHVSYQPSGYCIQSLVGQFHEEL